MLRIWLLIVAALATSVPLAAEDSKPPRLEQGRITGTVTDVNDDTLAGAIVVLKGSALSGTRTVLSDDNGFFEFGDLHPGTYEVGISAKGFSDWASPEVLVKPGQYIILAGSKLKIAAALTTVSVVYAPEQVALEQVKIEEQQRILGIIPNFYVVYDHDAAPMPAKLKFQLALRTSIDPVTIVGVGAISGINQAANVPDYGQGMKGYGERFGAATADGVSDIMIGGAILPSLLHQDPRYFYQGTGTNKSRALHALSSPFICRGDNGHLQPNFSSVGGDLSSAALSNAYYPPSNRGAGLLFENLAISTGERMLSGVIQEFVLPKFTSRGRTKE